MVVRDAILCRKCICNWQCFRVRTVMAMELLASNCESIGVVAIAGFFNLDIV